MIQRTLQQISEMIEGAELRTDAPSSLIGGVSTDTRTIQQGNLYVPLIGETFDGHEYVLHAYERGAVAVLWQRDHITTIEIEESGIPVIVVDDTLVALQQLAASYRTQIPVKVIGITGSNGKTSTKDMVASVMATKYRVQKTKGNLNNHIGVPLTLLQMEENTEIVVVEMGMSGRGEIEVLSKIARPDVVIITNIGEAHMLQLGSREQIALAKFEIMDGLRGEGTLIYHGDEHLLQELVRKIDRHCRVISFGSDTEVNDYSPTDIRVQAGQTMFTANSKSNVLTELVIPLLGRHNVINALSAVAVGQLFGLDESAIRQGLQMTVPTGMRIELSRATHGLTILNDAYNASPSSMKAAILLLDELQGYQRKMIVLGDMLELGAESEKFHRDIGKLLCTKNFDYIFTYGELAAYISEECRATYAPEQLNTSNDKKMIFEQLAHIVSPEDIILVKASRGKRLEELVDMLKQI